jgi:hypothetical protein
MTDWAAAQDALAQSTSAFGPDPTVESIALRRAEYDVRAGRWPLFGRQVADSRDRVGWAKARSGAIGGSDAAGFAKLDSAHLYQRAKQYNPFTGNAYTAHGNDREPSILAALHVEQNFTLFRSAGNDRHVATPDGIKLGDPGDFFLVQAKTVQTKTKLLKTGERVPVEAFTNAKGERVIPPAYQRQVQWEQYVCGADRTLFVWEEHDNGQPLTMEPESVWIYRDDEQIRTLITIADIVLAGIDAGAAFTKEMESAS